jgi:hypothetical protein
MKVGSERAFCYMIAPGQDAYHRIADAEIYFLRGDERLCIPCAARSGLIELEPKALRQPVVAVDIDDAGDPLGYDVGL